MSEKEGEDEDDDFGSLGLIMTSSLIRGIWDSFDSSFFLMMFIMLMLMSLSLSLSLLFDVILVLPSTLIIGIGADLFNRGAVSTLWTPVTVISSSTT